MTFELKFYKLWVVNLNVNIAVLLHLNKSILQWNHLVRLSFMYNAGSIVDQKWLNCGVSIFKPLAVQQWLGCGITILGQWTANELPILSHLKLPALCHLQRHCWTTVGPLLYQIKYDADPLMIHSRAIIRPLFHHIKYDADTQNSPLFGLEMA